PVHPSRDELVDRKFLFLGRQPIVALLVESGVQFLLELRVGKVVFAEENAVHHEKKVPVPAWKRSDSRRPGRSTRPAHSGWRKAGIVARARFFHQGDEEKRREGVTRTKNGGQ